MFKNKSSRRESFQPDATATGTESERDNAQSHSQYNAPGSNKALVFFRACEWRDLNPEIWDSWVQAAVNEARHKRRFSMQFVIEQTRKYDRVNRNGEPVKINNSFAPIWARMLATERPELRGYIELRKSEWDADFPDVKGFIDG